MEQCLGGRNDEARGERKETIAAQAELKNFPGVHVRGLRPVCHRFLEPLWGQLCLIAARFSLLIQLDFRGTVPSRTSM
jgi:hypothetical protein